MAYHRIAQLMTARHVPQPNRHVLARGGHDFAVGAECDSIDAIEAEVVGLHQRLTQRLTAGHVPQPNGSVIARRGQHLAVWAERYASDRTGVAPQRVAELLASSHIPQPHGVVRTT